MENKKQGFTLVELIVVLAIIAALIGILIAVIKPQQIFARLRDTQRSGDLNNLSRAIDIYITEFANQPSTIKLARPDNNYCVDAATKTIYYSVATSGSVPGGYVANGTTSQAIDGTGWLPVPLASSTMLQLPKLPLDPRNGYDNHFYYTYGCKKNDFTYELNARPEIITDLASNDAGNASTLLEVGPDKNILPAATTGFYQ